MDKPETDTPNSLVETPTDGRFVEGHKGGPGRPKGSRNRVKMIQLEVEEACRLQLASVAQSIIAKSIDMALEGNEKVMAVLLDKYLSSPKDTDDSEIKPNEVRVVIVGPSGSDAPKLTILKPSDRPVLDVTPESIPATKEKPRNGLPRKQRPKAE